MPELMVGFRRDISFGGFDRRLLNVGYNHQSNGRSDPIPRSWDRIIVSIGIERGNFPLVLRPWVRIDEGDSDDDNPDITDYFGSRNRLKARDRAERSPHRRRPA